MKRFWPILIVFCLAGCQVLPPPAGKQAAVQQTAALHAASPAPATPTAAPATATVAPTATALQPRPTSTPTATAQPTAVATQTPVLEPPSPTNSPIAASAYQLHWHPDGPLFSGDSISLEVVAPPGEKMDGKIIQVMLKTPGGEQKLGSANFEPFGLGERLQATFWWFWDTNGLPAGDYTLDFTLLPDGSTWQETVTLLPAVDLPPAERNAAWESAESQCCRLYYIRGSAAERDLAALMNMVDAQARDAGQKLGIQPDEKIPLVLLPRVLGHGGFTSQEIAVSYLDRNYAGRATDLVLHHEIVHWLDGKLGGEFRPTLFVEGLAVYLTGGHFKPEPLMARAAALLDPQAGCAPVAAGQDRASPAVETGTATPAAPACGLDRYIPLAGLADNFYPSQHEIGYLEAGALIEYMVKTWGWTAFNDFYRDIHPPAQPTSVTPTAGAAPGASQSAVIDAALQTHFQINLDELEENFIAALRQERLTPALVEDVSLSVDYFDTLRRYQQMLDPSAYYLTAWLADTVEMRKHGIVADFTRHPQGTANQALELLFGEADTALRAGEYAQAARRLAAINAVLDRISGGEPDAFGADRLAADMVSIVQTLQAAGYQAQRAELGQSKARVWVSTSGPGLIELHMQRGPRGWQILITLSVNEHRPGEAWSMFINTQRIMDRYTTSSTAS